MTVSGRHLKIGLVGCGAIGSQLALAASRNPVYGLRVHALADTVPEKAAALAAKIRPRPAVLGITTLARQSDIMVEAAGKDAVPGIVREALKHRKHLMILSIGALVESPQWLEDFRKRHCGLYFPSGAIGGLDALKAAATGRLQRVTLVTRKHPRALQGAPFFKKHRMDPSSIKQPVSIFSGTAKRAIQLFPANVNIAAAVSLVGLGPQKTRVEIIADPRTRSNTHTLVAEGDFGRMTLTVENRPSQENPKTSRLAAQAALAQLSAIARGERFGT